MLQLQSYGWWIDQGGGSFMFLRVAARSADGTVEVFKDVKIDGLTGPTVPVSLRLPARSDYRVSAAELWYNTDSTGYPYIFSMGVFGVGSQVLTLDSRYPVAVAAGRSTPVALSPARMAVTSINWTKVVNAGEKFSLDVTVTPRIEAKLLTWARETWGGIIDDDNTSRTCQQGVFGDTLKVPMVQSVTEYPDRTVVHMEGTPDVQYMQQDSALNFRVAVAVAEAGDMAGIYFVWPPLDTPRTSKQPPLLVNFWRRQAGSNDPGLVARLTKTIKTALDPWGKLGGPTP